MSVENHAIVLLVPLMQTTICLANYPYCRIKILIMQSCGLVWKDAKIRFHYIYKRHIKVFGTFSWGLIERWAVLKICFRKYFYTHHCRMGVYWFCFLFSHNVGGTPKRKLQRPFQIYIYFRSARNSELTKPFLSAGVSVWCFGWQD